MFPPADKQTDPKRHKYASCHWTKDLAKVQNATPDHSGGNGGVHTDISVQTLNEFTNVARRKLGMSWKEIGESIAVVRAVCPTILDVTVATHEEALRIAERYGYAMFDALIVASALQADSETLWSEDMQHDLLIEGRLRIVNPFRTTA